MGTHDPTTERDPRDQRATTDDSNAEAQRSEPLVQQAVREAASELGERRINRRRLLTTGAATGVAATAVSLGVSTTRSQDATPEVSGTPSGGMAGHDMAGMDAGPQTNQGFTYFVPFQAAIVQAAAARLIPTDELGPGATEAGVVYFIDRQLTKGDMGFRGKEYQLGPYQTGAPTQGDQSGLPVRERFRLGIFGLEAYAQQLFGKGFVQCSPEEQDRMLTDLEQGIPENFGGVALQAQPLSGAPTESPTGQETDVGVNVGAEAFFTLLWQWTLAGFFCDPVQGGNRDMVGWKLIGFPGAHISYAADIEKYNQPFQGDYISLGQYQEQIGGGV